MVAWSITPSASIPSIEPFCSFSSIVLNVCWTELSNGGELYSSNRWINLSSSIPLSVWRHHLTMRKTDLFHTIIPYFCLPPSILTSIPTSIQSTSIERRNVRIHHLLIHLPSTSVEEIEPTATVALIHYNVVRHHQPLTPSVWWNHLRLMEMYTCIARYNGWEDKGRLASNSKALL